MRNTIFSLISISAVLTVCLFICIPPALADFSDEWEQYRKAISLIERCIEQPGNLDQAIAIAQKMLEKNPNSFMAYTVMGWATWWQGYIDEDHHDLDKVRAAQKYFHKALETEPRFIFCEFYLAYSYVTSGEYDKALSIAEKHQTLTPDSPGSYFIPILVAYKKKDHETVVKLCLDLTNKFPNDKNVRGFIASRLGTAYMELGQLDKAEELCLKGIEEDPNNFFALGNYAKFLCDYKKDYDKAIEYAQKALAIMDYKGARRALSASAALKGEQLVDRGKLEEAEPYYLMAVKNDPNLTMAWMRLTSIYMSLAAQNKDPERMKQALAAAKNVQRHGENIKGWDHTVAEIESLLKEMRNKGKHKPETKD